MYVRIDMECGNTKEGCRNIVRLAITWRLMSEGYIANLGDMFLEHE